MRASPASRVQSALRTLSAALTLPLLAAPSLDAQTAIGLSGVRAQAFFNEEIGGFPPEENDFFALALAAGDFNGDGAQDLATGIPGDNGPTDLPLDNAGAVIVRWGVPGRGLATTPAPTLLSLYAGGPQPAHEGDLYGDALAAGDFNGDGLDDLAVGIPWLSTTVGENYDFGAVAIHYGEPGGIQLAPEHVLLSGAGGNIPVVPGGRSRLGSALAAGDFDANGYDDLAIGAPQDCCGNNGGGGVIVLHGGIGGLFPVVAYLIHQDDPPVPDDGEDPDDFGYALAAGNFNGDFRSGPNGTFFPIDDLAMSAPGEDGIGAVMVMLGGVGGLIFADSIYLGQGDLGRVGEADDRFGTSLAAGNFDGDYRCLPSIFCTPIDDLAIGTPQEDLGASNENVDAGEVTVLYGVATGFFDLARTDHLTQGAIFGSTAYDQSGDLFGHALAAGDFDGDGKDDLAAGQPGENVGGSDRGGVTILMGAVGGLYDRFRFLAAGINGVLPGPQENAKMGYALAVGDFEGNGYSDLAIGIPNRDQAGIGNAGAESILYGALFADGFVSGNDDYWSVSNP